MELSTFYAAVDGTQVKKFKKSPSAFLNGNWPAFNRYAKGRGFILPIRGADYIGGVAWRNAAGQTMKLVEGE